MRIVADRLRVTDQQAGGSSPPERGLECATYPVHEVTAHPAAPDVIRLLARQLVEACDPILTPGTPLASREDWAQVVAAAKQCGAHALWVAFHGYGGEHDRQLNRPGAFEETCLAARRARKCGLGTGANVFLTKPTLRDFDRLLAVLLDLRLDMFAISVAACTPTARGRRYEAPRSELGDLLPIAQQVFDESLLGREQWSSLEWHTEAACAALHARGLTRRTPTGVVGPVPRPDRQPAIREAMTGRLRQLELSRNHARRRPSQGVTAADSKLNGC